METPNYFAFPWRRLRHIGSSKPGKFYRFHLGEFVNTDTGELALVCWSTLC